MSQNLNKLQNTKVGDNIDYFVNGDSRKGTVVKMNGSYVTIVKDNGSYDTVHIDETFFVKDIITNKKSWDDMSMEERMDILYKSHAYSPRFLSKTWKDLPSELKDVIKSGIETGAYGAVAGTPNAGISTEFDEDSPKDYEGRSIDKDKEQFKHEEKKPEASKVGHETKKDGGSMTTGTSGAVNTVYDEQEKTIKKAKDISNEPMSSADHAAMRKQGKYPKQEGGFSPKQESASSTYRAEQSKKEPSATSTPDTKHYTAQRSGEGNMKEITGKQYHDLYHTGERDAKGLVDVPQESGGIRREVADKPIKVSGTAGQRNYPTASESKSRAGGKREGAGRKATIKSLSEIIEYNNLIIKGMDSVTAKLEMIKLGGGQRKDIDQFVKPKETKDMAGNVLSSSRQNPSSNRLTSSGEKPKESRGTEATSGKEAGDAWMKFFHENVGKPKEEVTATPREADPVKVSRDSTPKESTLAKPQKPAKSKFEALDKPKTDGRVKSLFETIEHNNSIIKGGGQRRDIGQVVKPKELKPKPKFDDITE